MQLQRLVRWWQRSLRVSPTTDVDAEIREELEFHLDMRMADNIREGMPFDVARSDAQRRFGDFETVRQACRRITLGPRIMIARIQAVLSVALLAMVVYQGVQLSKLQTASKNQIDQLTQQIAELQVTQPIENDPRARMPFVFWRPMPITSDAVGEQTMESLPPGWDSSPEMLSRPWSDWTPITGELLPMKDQLGTHSIAVRY